MLMSDRNKYGCACCDPDRYNRKDTRAARRTIKRRERQNWKREWKEFLHKHGVKVVADDE